MATEWVDTLPNSIRVGTHDCRIQKMNKPWGTNQWVVITKTGPKKVGLRYGDYEVHTHVIRIRRHMQSRALVIDTIIHELTHAIWECFLLKSSDKEERLVHLMATGWTQVILDNPDFCDWLTNMRR